jgi:nucleotide-binding universal stress UspA family protein
VYKRVLVPLDGSQYSQCSLEHVRAIGLGCNVPEIILLRVIETDSPAAGKDNSAPKAAAPPDAAAEARDYISGLARRLKDEGLEVRGELISGNPAEQINNYARANRVDLIIMSTRGRSGIGKELGSVARAVVDFSTIPVLLVLAAGCRVGQGC